MENTINKGAIIYQIALPVFLFSFLEIQFFTTVVEKDVSNHINQTLDDVNTQLTTEYTKQLKNGQIDNEQFLRRTYEAMVILSKMQRHYEEDLQSSNAYLKKLSYFLFFMFGLFVLFAAFRVKNDFDGFDMSSVISGHVIVNTILLIMISSIFQYNFYKHFVRGYKYLNSEEIVAQIITQLNTMFQKPDELNCGR